MGIMCKKVVAIVLFKFIFLLNGFVVKWKKRRRMCLNRQVFSHLINSVIAWRKRGGGGRGLGCRGGVGWVRWVGCFLF